MQNWASPDKKEDLFMKKKTLSVLLAAAMTTGLLAGCGSGDKAAETTAPAATTKAESGETTAETAAPEGGKKYDGVELTYWSMSVSYTHLTDLWKGDCPEPDSAGGWDGSEADHFPLLYAQWI